MANHYYDRAINRWEAAISAHYRSLGWFRTLAQALWPWDAGPDLAAIEWRWPRTPSGLRCSVGARLRYHGPAWRGHRDLGACKPTYSSDSTSARLSTEPGAGVGTDRPDVTWSAAEPYGDPTYPRPNFRSTP